MTRTIITTYAAVCVLTAALLPGDPMAKKSCVATQLTDAQIDNELLAALRRGGYLLQSNVIIQRREGVLTLFGGHNGVRHAARKVLAEAASPDLRAELTALLKEAGE